MKIWTSEKMKFQIFSEPISYVISIYLDYKIEYFYRENRYILMLLFKHLPVQITSRVQLSWVICLGSIV